MADRVRRVMRGLLREGRLGVAFLLLGEACRAAPPRGLFLRVEMHQKAKEKEAEDAKKAGENGEVRYLLLPSICRIQPSPFRSNQTTSPCTLLFQFSQSRAPD